MTRTGISLYYAVSWLADVSHARTIINQLGTMAKPLEILKF